MTGRFGDQWSWCVGLRRGGLLGQPNRKHYSHGLIDSKPHRGIVFLNTTNPSPMQQGLSLSLCLSLSVSLSLSSLPLNPLFPLSLFFNFYDGSKSKFLLKQLESHQENEEHTMKRQPVSLLSSPISRLTNRIDLLLHCLWSRACVPRA